MSGHVRRDYGTWAAMGASFSAVLSSACCWLPLLLLAFGASAAGVSGYLEDYRAPLLAVTGVLLASGFYLVYFRKPRCGPGGECSVPRSKLARLNEGILWMATILVTGFALFPNYVGALVSRRGPAPVQGPSILLEVDGMTCEACALHVEAELRGVPGVLDAQVDYDERLATVIVEPSGPPEPAALESAVARAGYRAAVRGHSTAGP